MGLVISQNLVLSQPVYVPDGTPLILWDSIVTTTNITADSEAVGYPATNLANAATNQEWRAAAAGDVEITITTGSADDQSGVGIARHNFGTEQIAVEVGYYVDPSASPPVWVSLAGPQIPANDEPLLFWFTAQPLAAIVVRLTEGTAAARAAVLYAGDLLVMERSVDADKEFTVPRFARKTEAVNARSERGDYLGRIVTSQYTDGIEHAYSHLRGAFYRDSVDPFIRAAQQDVPFFYALQPDDYPYEVAYAWLTDDPMPKTNPATDRTSVVLKMGGILE